jgi:hypothetical protein
MSNLIAPLEYFLEGGHPEFAPHRAVANATRHLSVYRVENFRLERVCSLDEFRTVVSVGGMMMLTFALEMLPLKGLATSWRTEFEFKDVPTLQTMVAQGNSPMLIEGANRLRKNWPNHAGRLTGYQGGMTGYGRIWDACWLERRQVLDAEHGVASVYPRLKEIMKYLKTKGFRLEHEALIHTAFGALQKSSMLQFLDV